MGDPKKHRKKYSTPGHPWQRARIEEESHLMQEYGFKNKTEIWKMNAFLKSATAQAKKLVTLSGSQADIEKNLLLTRMKRYGLLPMDAVLDSILSISLRDVLERRLQTIVYKRGLANSVKQSRQFITHEHILIGDKVVTSPSYLVPLSEEGLVVFSMSSALADPEHPERIAAKKAKDDKLSNDVISSKDDDLKKSKDSKDSKDSKKDSKRDSKKNNERKKFQGDNKLKDKKSKE